MIILNGEPTSFAGATLDQLLQEQEMDPVVVATAVNGDFVPRGLRAETVLADGDKVEIFSPRQGG